MPPRRTSSKITSANKTEANGRTSATSASKRTMKLRRIRDKSINSSNANLSPDELGTSVKTHDTKQAGSDEEVVLDEIIVSSTPQNSDMKGVDSKDESAVATTSTVTATPLRRSSRTSSISQSARSTASPLGRGIVLKKQDVKTSTAGDGDGNGEVDELSPPPHKKPKGDTKLAQHVTSRTSHSKWDNPDEMLTNHNSPLTTARLRELLCSPKAWDILSQPQRERILAKFPDNTKILDHNTPNARPDIAALLNNNNFRHDVARYQDGLSKGFHDPEWIHQAQAAHRSREMGFYDDFMADDFEEKWEVPMPKQSETGSEADENDSRLVDDTSEEQENGAPKAIAQSEEVASQYQGTNGTPQLISADLPREESIDTSVQGQNGDTEGTDDSKAAPADNMSRAEDKKNDQPFENGAGQAVQTQVGVATAQDPTEQETHSRDIGISSTPSLPDIMEGVLHQNGENESETTAARRGDAAENTGNPNDVASAQATVDRNHITEDNAKQAQQQNGQAESKAVEENRTSDE
ncbi:Asx homology domain-containing protein [Xylaria digitata]|nr:Asx homology domain-containing protein [Xylaria digitata]